MSDNQEFVPDDHHNSLIINIPQDEIESYITTEKEINLIEPGDAALDVIGLVVSKSDRCMVMSNSQSMEVLNFVLEFENGIQLPVAVWGVDIARLNPFIRLNAIVHLDSPYSKPCDPSRFTNMKDYIITCRSNTNINLLKMKNQMNSDSTEKKNCKNYSKISDYLDENDTDEKCICLTCYIKTEFRRDDRSLRKIGSVTDKFQKLVVIVKSYDTDVVFETGQPIKLFGYMHEKDGKFEFFVESERDIVKINEKKLKEEELDNIFVTPKRKLPGSKVFQSTEKKMKNT